MKVSREQAAENRARVVKTATRLFRERGFDGVAVADLMREAGLTHGGFYGQFKSKDALELEACRDAAALAVRSWEKRATAENIYGYYLSETHLCDPGGGCVYATLASDVSRSKNKKLKRVFADGFTRLVDILAAALPGAAKARRQKALSSFSMMVGAVLLARAVGDDELSEEILAATRAELGV